MGLGNDKCPCCNQYETLENFIKCKEHTDLNHWNTFKKVLNYAKTIPPLIQTIKRILIPSTRPTVNIRELLGQVRNTISKDDNTTFTTQPSVIVNQQDHEIDTPSAPIQQHPQTEDTIDDHINQQITDATNEQNTIGIIYMRLGYWTKSWATIQNKFISNIYPASSITRRWSEKSQQEC